MNAVRRDKAGAEAYRQSKTRLLPPFGDPLNEFSGRLSVAPGEVPGNNQVYSESHGGHIPVRFEDRQKHPLSRKGEKK